MSVKIPGSTSSPVPPVPAAPLVPPEPAVPPAPELPELPELPDVPDVPDVPDCPAGSEESSPHAEAPRATTNSEVNSPDRHARAQDDIDNVMCPCGTSRVRRLVFVASQSEIGTGWHSVREVISRFVGENSQDCWAEIKAMRGASQSRDPHGSLAACPRKGNRPSYTTTLMLARSWRGGVVSSLPQWRASARCMRVIQAHDLVFRWGGRSTRARRRALRAHRRTSQQPLRRALYRPRRSRRRRVSRWRRRPLRQPALRAHQRRLLRRHRGRPRCFRSRRRRRYPRSPTRKNVFRWRGRFRVSLSSDATTCTALVAWGRCWGWREFRRPSARVDGFVCTSSYLGRGRDS